jgi:hypothetical protein
MPECKTCGHNLPAGYCHTCLQDFPPETMSPDLRYCPGCYEFLTAEASLLPAKRKKPTWEPVPGRAGALPDAREVVTKIADKGMPPMTPVGIMLHGRGRPRKDGKVTRMTEWRRKKELQGVLI